MQKMQGKLFVWGGCTRTHRGWLLPLRRSAGDPARSRRRCRRLPLLLPAKPLLGMPLRCLLLLRLHRPGVGSHHGRHCSNCARYSTRIDATRAFDAALIELMLFDQRYRCGF
jgi:hypothetical protein